MNAPDHDKRIQDLEIALEAEKKKVVELEDEIEWLTQIFEKTKRVDAENLRLTQVAENLLYALQTYSEHHDDCILSQQQGGRKTKDGGYEMFYGYGTVGKWLIETPECQCDLNKFLALSTKPLDE